MSIQALVYKSWRIHIRHYLRTLILIAIPVVPFIIILYSSDGGQSNNNSWHQDAIIYEMRNKNELLSQDAGKLKVVYYPNNTLTQTLMSNVKNILRGEFVGVNQESDVEKWLINNTDHKNLYAGPDIFGVIFKIDNSSIDPPLKFCYTVRGDREKLPPTDLFPIEQRPGPMEAGAQYFNSQFMRLKIAIDDSFLKQVGIKTATNWTLQEFPYPDHGSSGRNNPLKVFLPIAIIFLFSYVFSSGVTLIVNEKKAGITERLRMVGLNNWILLLGHLIHIMMTCSISTIILTIVFKTKIGSSTLLPFSNFVIVWLVLFLFCLHSAAFFIALSALFTNANLAFAVSLLIYLAPQFLLSNMGNVSVTGQVFTSFLPVSYLLWAFQDVLGYESSGLGSTFSTIFLSPSAGYCDIPLALLIVLSLLGTALFCVLYIYLININPGPYGYAKPWYFIFPKKYLCRVNPGGILKNENSVGDISKGLYEKVPENIEIGLKISNLHKKFGNVISVKDLSLDIYVGQITALLGHNGAGKTTTLSMITGMFKPTSGTIYYQGYDVFSNLTSFRLELGLCPQEDMLMGEHTVWEHLMIFSMIKKLNRNEMDSNVNRVLNSVGLSDKKYVIVNNLSGGMKRKLCLALALIGNPKILVLDEPTSGLDPESRREIWNILLKFREDKIMIITTHFMEEADALGDQIAIMDHGEIKCYGTPMFLKNHYGAGYQITLTCPELLSGDIVDLGDIIDFVTSKIPLATVMNKAVDHIVFNVPSSESGSFPSLFKQLEDNKKFNISRIGVNCTTMDDVFLKVQEDADKGNSSKKSFNSNLFQDVMLISARSVNPFTSFLQRLLALMLKNIMYLKDKWFSILLLGIFFPLISSYWCATFPSELFVNDKISSVTFDLKLYGVSEVLLDGSHTPKLRESFTELIKGERANYFDVSTLHEKNIIAGLLHVALDDELKFRQSMIVAGSFNDSIPNILYSSIAIHSPIIALNLLYNSILKADEVGLPYSISTTSEPLQFTLPVCSATAEVLKIVYLTFWAFWIIILCTFIGNIFIKAPHTERTSLMKHLQFMTGLSPFTYWLSFFICDFILYCICVGLAFTIFMFWDDAGLLSSDNAAGVFIFIHILFGISQIWMAYCFSFLFKTPASASSLFLPLCLVIMLSSVLCFNLIPEQSNWIFINYILRLIPPASSFYAMQLFVFKAFSKMQCRVCTNAYVLPQCSEGSIQGSFFDSDLSYELYFLGLDWIIYLTFLMLVDFGILAKLWNIVESMLVGIIKESKLESIESDVAKERDRVDAALHSDNMGESLVIVDGLAKKYSRSFTAVYDVSFASKEGECFGLLGINGAGKTTTFNILSGVIMPTQGRVLIKGYDLNRNRRMCLSYMGYCPQFSALGDGLTGRQMLSLFANLRLAQPVHINNLVQKWIILLGIEEYSDRICNTYSGGNKRKLSTAMAFINNPAIILLDEPTSGVDPVTRRNLWNVLKNSQNNKQTVIISSHSMDECEAVCDRLTIMVRGYMQCIGNTQRLKKLYGQGFVVLIKLKDHLEDELDILKQEMEMKFGSKALLKDEHKILLHYHIADQEYPLSMMFGIMEEVKNNFKIIEEFSISDASLEHIFLSFAKKKGENEAETRIQSPN